MTWLDERIGADIAHRTNGKTACTFMPATDTATTGYMDATRYAINTSRDVSAALASSLRLKRHVSNTGVQGVGRRLR